MNDNVIPIKQDKEPFTYGICGNQIVVADREKKLEIGFSLYGPAILMSGYGISYTREELAQILWAAAYLLDSEERWRKGEYIGKDYENKEA